MEGVRNIPGALGHYLWAKGTTVKELLQEARNKKKAKVLPKRARGRNQENFVVLKVLEQIKLIRLLLYTHVEFV